MDQPDSPLDQNTNQQNQTEQAPQVVTSGGKASGLRQLWRNPYALVVALLVAGAGSYLLITSFASPNTAPTPPTNANKPDNIAPTPQAAPDRVLLRFKAGVPQATQDKLLARYQGKVASDLPQIGVKVITVPEKARDAVIAALEHNPAVSFAEKDYVVSPTTTTPNDPYYFGSPPAPYSGNSAVQIYQWPFTTTQTNQLWDTTTGSANTVVAVLDTGFLPSLPDAGTFVSNWNVVNNNSDVTPVHPHGMYVSGVVNARGNNGVGVASSCWNCSVMGVRVSTSADGSAYWSDMAKGITYATDHGAKIINMSFAGTSSSSAMQSAEQYAIGKGLVLFAAAGNLGISGNPVEYPAADPGVIGVAMLDGSTDNSFDQGSEHGSWIPIAAPSGIMTTWKDGSYNPVGGTSIASPFAAGVTALVWTAKPTATAAQIKQAIFSTTDPITGGPSGYSVQYGRINGYKALQSLSGATAPAADTSAPTTSISAPATGTTVSGQVSVNVTASDNVGVSKVELYRNGALYATTTAAPYSFYWDTTTSANGSYTLTVKAYDAAGNVGTSAAVALTVNNKTESVAPTASVTAPTDGSTVSGKTNVTVTASDAVGVVSTELYVDGVLRNSNTTNSLSFAWDTTSETNSAHTLVAKAYDAAGNVGTSSTITVTVSNQAPATDTTQPVVTITNPLAGSSVAGNETISATASDNVGVTKMELLIDDKLKTTSTSGTISSNWNTRKLSAGIHTITVNAYDVAGNKTTVTEQVIR